MLFAHSTPFAPGLQTKYHQGRNISSDGEGGPTGGQQGILETPVSFNPLLVCNEPSEAQDHESANT